MANESKESTGMSAVLVLDDGETYSGINGQVLIFDEKAAQDLFDTDDFCDIMDDISLAVDNRKIKGEFFNVAPMVYLVREMERLAKEGFFDPDGYEKIKDILLQVRG